MMAREVVDEIVGNEELIARVTGRVPWLFRPPYGAMTALARDVCEARGLTQVGWTIGAADFIEQSPLGVVQTFRNKLDALEKRGIRGGIVMLHDAKPWTAEALPFLLDWIRRRNCELLAADEELYELVDFDRFFRPRRQVTGPLEPDRFYPAEEPSSADASAWQARVREDAARWCAGR
jgi:peptidoglycan/xylan/chitin deacetylase (PgdA/CDA1 family)